MSDKTAYDKLVDWLDVKFGFGKTPLKPVPDFTLNPIYWLGALLAVTFALQALTGIFMLLYYVPTPAEAYSSTTFVINSVPLGHLTETFHLYTAYAMILLTFLHLVRNYFGSAHKGNRDLMWLVGIGLGAVVVSFGVTGYLLPWTVISKSASDVAIGFINFLPTSLANLGKFVVTGSGSDASQLTTFLHVHTVFLPLALIAFLGLKIYMYEVHGPAYVPAYGKPKTGKYYRWFPKIFLYALILGCSYVSILLAVSSLFPLALPPAYSPATAGQYVVQPDWYLLFVYQILKIQAFEGPEAVYALVGLAVFVVLLFLLPFYDRSKRRNLTQRPVFATIGAILVVELIALTIWGYFTPGQVIPNYQAVLVLGGVAVATAALLAAVYRFRRKSVGSAPLMPPAVPSQPATSSTAPAQMEISKMSRFSKGIRQLFQTMFTRFTAVFVVFLIVGSVSLASLVNMLPNILGSATLFGLAAAGFAISCFFMCIMLRNVVSAYENAVTSQ
jgi:quinol-cytochrome oxidoreductase complex cytochrome b subunit